LRELVSPPPELVTEGRFNHGSFTGPIPTLNARDAAVYPWLPKVFRGFRLKEWQAVQVGTERYFAIVALFNAKTLAVAQVKVFDKVEGTKVVYEKKLSPFAFRVPSTLMDSTLAYEGRGAKICFENRLKDQQVRVQFDFRGKGTSKGLSADFVIDTSPPTHQVVCQPLGKGRAMYSHKGQFPVTGQLVVGGDEVELEPKSAYAFLDDHKGFYPYVMEWDWVTGGGFLPDGRRVGFNFTRNQALEPERYNENALWLGDELHVLGPVTFERLGAGAGEHWIIRDQEGHVDLRFDVTLDARVNVNLLVIRSRYRGPFGRFSGSILGPRGESISCDGLFGMGERFYLRT